ncbi:MAG: hypothetical protein ACE5OR_11805 [bacterium]
MIYQVMEKIIRRQIPAAVDWTLATNEVTVVDGDVPATWKGEREPGTGVDNAPEPDIFKAEQGADPYYPTVAAMMDRRFQRDREIPEDEAKALFSGSWGFPRRQRNSWFPRLPLTRPGEPDMPWAQAGGWIKPTYAQGSHPPA